MIEVNGTSFETEVLKSEQPVVVDFWAEWCGPCKMLAPVLDEIATENAGRFKVVKVNVDDNPELASQYRISAIPTLLFFSNGNVTEQSVGAISKKGILARLQALDAVA
jgi:thioredoxin 1